MYFGKGLIITCHCIFVFSTDPLLANKLYGKLCMLPLCGNDDCGVMGVPNGGMNIVLSQWASMLPKMCNRLSSILASVCSLLPLFPSNSTIVACLCCCWLNWTFIFTWLLWFIEFLPEAFIFTSCPATMCSWTAYAWVWMYKYLLIAMREWGITPYSRVNIVTCTNCGWNEDNTEHWWLLC